MNFLNRNKSGCLTAQIRAAERQVLNRQQRVGKSTATLIRKIHHQMIAPATLLLAGGVGFILGELTKRHPPNNHGPADQPRAAETSPLRTALNLIASVRTVYTALPLAWMIKSFQQRRTSSGCQTSERQS